MALCGSKTESLCPCNKAGLPNRNPLRFGGLLAGGGPCEGEPDANVAKPTLPGAYGYFLSRFALGGWEQTHRITCPGWGILPDLQVVEEGVQNTK